MSVRLVIRLRPDGRHYDVEHQGALVASASDDPEHDVARVLVARGILGPALTVDAKTGTPRLRFNIATFARTRTVERSAGGITIEPWRPLPSPSSHGGARRRFSKAGVEEVVEESANAFVIDRGRST